MNARLVIKLNMRAKISLIICTSLLLINFSSFSQEFVCELED